MNYSGVLVKTLPGNQDKVVKLLNDSGLCEVQMYENGHIIVVIEGKDTEEEVNKLKQIMELENVISADMIYSYVEDNIDKLREELTLADDVPGILKDNKIKAENIKYGGDLRKKI